MLSASKGVVWVEDTTFNIPIGFNFFFLDHELAQAGINQTNLFMPQRAYYIAAFGNFLMYDRGNDHGGLISLSPINYVIDSSGGTGAKILKIQWLNAGYFFDTSMFLNVQVWLYQGSNNIEIRYGTSNVNLDKSQVFGCGPLVGLAKVDTVSRVETYELYLQGDEHNPDTVGVGDTGRRCLYNVPMPGIIYRFIYHDRLGIAPSINSGFSIFPNPTEAKLNINLAENSPALFEISDISGRTISKQNLYASSVTDLSFLPIGVYIAKLSQSGNMYYQKLVINK